MLLKCWRSEQCRFASNNYSWERFKISTDNRSIKIVFAMSILEKVGDFLNTLTMLYELRYKWRINTVVMILSAPHCLRWLFYFQNINTFLFEKLNCAVEILIWSNAVDFLTKLLGMSYLVVTAQQACSTEMVKNVYLLWLSSLDEDEPRGYSTALCHVAYHFSSWWKQ